MKPIRLIHQMLRDQRDPGVDHALAAALLAADEHSREYLARFILKRNHPKGTAGLIQAFHLLPPSLQEEVVSKAGELYGPLRSVATGRDIQGPINAITIIQQSHRPRLAYLVTERLLHGPASLRPAAAGCLLDMAQWAQVEPGHAQPPRVDGQTAAFLLKAMDDAIGAYGTHLQPQIITAMMLMAPRPMPGAMRNLADWHHPVVEPMRRMLERPADKATRRFLLVAGRLPTLMNAALHGIHNCIQEGCLGDVLDASHLLLINATQRNIHRLGDPDRYWPQPQQIAQMPPAQSRSLARWAMALPLELAERVVRLSMLNRSSDPATRLAALRQLLALARDPQAEVQGVNAAICGYTSDTDAAIARIALRHLIRCKWKDLAQLLLRMVNHQHEDVRNIASQYLSSVGFDRLWNAWPRLETRQQLSAGKAMIKIDPQFHKHLGRKLMYVDRPTRLRALAIIYTLNQGPTFEKALVALTRDKDEMVASAAVRALGTTQSPASIETLETSLKHNDSRVRANAVEALQQADHTGHLEQIIEMAQHDQPRPRANAINVLLELRSAEAISSLTGMLSHQDSEFRASALWLVDHLGLIALARQVAEMSLEDPSDQVRSKASKVVQRLIERMNAHQDSQLEAFAQPDPNAPKEASPQAPVAGASAGKSAPPRTEARP